ncbi:FAD/NAD(P)-binding protein [Nocardioides campestrisoli]|uniref:FAD/NAD(P)-binding protein n=1 Tax=Nocardioides campestrisoli TaxID=2736757 RepID=UPI001C6396BD
MKDVANAAAPLRIAIVGAGAAGTLVALNVVRRSEPGTTLALTFVDPAEDLVVGAAFSTTDPRHLLNVPAAGMSFDPEDRFDFATWCSDQGMVDADEASYWFAPRREWARYLRQRWQETLAAAGDRVTVTHVRRRATGLVPDGTGITVTVEGDEPLQADRAVLATGLPSVGDSWAPRDLAGEPRYVADPWAPGALEALLADDEDVLVVGTGLTMVDVALSALGEAGSGRRVVALSRNGRLPQPHAPAYLGEVVPDVRAWGSTLPEVRAAVHAHVGAVAQLNGDWRPAIDGIRYRVAELWKRLSESDREAFLRDVAGEWGVRRHRIPPASQAALAEHQAAGRLEVRAGKITAVEGTEGGVEVTTADGDRLRFGWVVNCTGPRSDVRTLGNPVLDGLLGVGGEAPVATTDGLGLGLVTRDGRVVGADGDPLPLWTLGALRRGELWESTAIPEIRVQAGEVAPALLAD